MSARTKSFLAIDALTNYVQSESWQIRDIHEVIKEADAGEFATDEQVKAVFSKYSASSRHGQGWPSSRYAGVSSTQKLHCYLPCSR